MASLSTWEFVNLGQVVFQGQLNQLFLYWSLTGTWGGGRGRWGDCSSLPVYIWAVEVTTDDTVSTLVTELL